MHNQLFTKMGDIVKICFFAIAFAIPIHYFLIQPYRVADDLGAPLIYKNEIVIINRFNRSRFEHGDIVVYRAPNKKIGKVAGLPGERVRINDGILTIRTQNNDLIKEIPLFGDISQSLREVGDLDAHEYFLIDESDIYASNGLTDIRDIIGRPIFRIYPLNKISKLYQ